MSGWKKGLALLAALMLSSGVGANPERWQLNMTPGVTTSAHDVYQLHMIIFLVCCVIGVIVFGAIFYSILKFRKSQGAVAEKWSHNTTAEIIWTVVPILILVVMAVPATKTLMRMADTGDAEMTVKITGYQWKWRYEYVGTDVSFISSLARESDAARRLGSGVDVATVSNYLLDVDKPLILPTDTKIRFVITADDVIHSWWVPVLGWKQDAIPGFINEAWTSIKDPGTYRGQCAELCGKDHGFMPIVVEAKPKAEFQAWLAQQQAARPDVEATVKVDAAASDDQS
ncbi:MAG: cytochrome c oxidase subunit II [Xanthomonadales bacterium]|nr:cytochrome c oxidase subunit II [Xanthomonadales bacterium]MCB1628714.1 cytochrome c oxidase subunit II [Xanthomonadales bacterium]MCB1635586.1 cytochrome c oxidase subunit II [Xanthomonadales bacterium]